LTRPEENCRRNGCLGLVAVNEISGALGRSFSLSK
jgi:hypothetical protein